MSASGSAEDKTIGEFRAVNMPNSKLCPSYVHPSRRISSGDYENGNDSGRKNTMKVARGRRR
jgi:hypothetical protein